MRVGSRRFEGGCWPTARQRLLLRAVLLRGEPARAAWNEWRRGAELEKLDVGSRELLPLLHANLTRLGIESPLVPALRRARQATWLRNQRLLSAGEAALHALGAQGIDALALKGLALANAHYEDAGLRPMNDIDLLVERDRFEPALEALSRDGWSPRLGLANASVLTDAAGREIDLHSYALLDCPEPGSDAGFWDRRRTSRLGELAISLPAPSDLLLHAVLHGVEWTWRSAPSLLWVADAVVILDGAGRRFDWDALHEEARRRGLGCPLSHALDFLRLALDVPVPEERRARLRDGADWSARLYCWCKRAGVRGLLGSLPATWVEHQRAARAVAEPPRMTAFLALLRERLGARSPWSTPLLVCRKAVRRGIAVLRG